MNSPGGCRNLRCIVVGAGVSGILIAYKLQEAFGKDVDFHIFEKNEDLGGTWFENRYPGCKNDVWSHVYQFSFCPNPNWSSFYVSSSEIQAYLKAVVFHYSLNTHISYNSKVDKAVWDEIRSIWTISVENKGDFECDIFINAGGILNNFSFPQIKNLDRFAGPVLHTAAWQKDTNLRGKRVAIIGAGASAIQCLPTIQSEVKSADIYIRTTSWITPPTGSNVSSERNHVYSAEEKTKFCTDAEYSLRLRKDMEASFNSMYKASFKGSEKQFEIREKFESYMKGRIASEDLQKKLIPTFEVGCRRTSPGEEYLEALQEQNVTPIFDPIEEATVEGIKAGGKVRPVDLIIAATGFDTSFRPRYSIVGTNGIDLRDVWKNDPDSYMGLAVSGFPNYLMFLGPNTPIANGSLIGTLEATGDYFVRLLKKFVNERVRSFEVREEVQADFNSHTQRMMQNMVWTGGCSSWFKSKTGRITAVWPGSSLHYRQVLDSNRWEDFHWKYKGNRFGHWDQGFSEIEIESTKNQGVADFAYYITHHDNLPLEAYYLAAKGGDEPPIIPMSLRPRSQLEDDTKSLSEFSWETKIPEPEACEVPPHSTGL